MTKNKLFKQNLTIGADFSFVRTLCKVSGFKYENGMGVYLLTDFWGKSYIVWVENEVIVKIEKE